MPAAKTADDDAVDLGAPVAADAAGSVHARSAPAKKQGSALDFDLDERSAEDSSGVDLSGIHVPAVALSKDSGLAKVSAAEADEMAAAVAETEETPEQPEADEAIGEPVDSSS